MAILEARGKGLQVVAEMIRLDLETVKKKVLHAGPVEMWGIDQRIRNAKRNREPFTKARQNELDSAQDPRKITANRKQQSQFANSIKILGSASLGLSASLLMIKTTDLILRA